MSRIKPPKADTVENEILRMKNDHGVNRWPQGGPFTGKAAKQIRTTARSFKRQSDARKFLTSGDYGGRQSDVTLKAKGFIPPAQERGSQLASYDNPCEDVTAIAQITSRTKAKRNPPSIKQEISAEQRLALYTPEPSDSYRQPTNSGGIPYHVREQLSKSLYQPSWYSTAFPLDLKRSKLDAALPKNAKMDLRFYNAKTSGVVPKTGRFPPALPDSCFRANELGASLTQTWSLKLRDLRGGE